MRFVDTNVLLYAVSDDPAEAGKRERAREVLSEPDLAVSVQVLQEFYVQATRRARAKRLSSDSALRFLEPILLYQIQAMTPELFLDAVEISHRFQLSYWDGAIIAAARILGCEAIYTEDLNPGQHYGAVRTLNPFANPPPPA